MTCAAPHSQFEPAPADSRLRAGEVHLWRARLDEPPADAERLLAPEEWQRADRFHFARDRERFVAAHALLRLILGRYEHCDPRELRFTHGAHGKPQLEDSALRFNLSHSGDLLLLAVTYGREVGVDVEEMRDNVPVEMLADHYFEPAEAWSLRLLPTPERVWRFYNVWTGIEAQLKAGGVGLANGTRVVEPDRWSLLSLRPAEGFAGALAVEGAEFQLACWSWTT